MTAIELPAHAKINLTLDVLGKRPDSYHELQTIMHTIALHDTVRIKKIQPVTTCNRLKSDCENLPTGEANIAYRAAQIMQEKFGLGGVEIFLQKKIPMGAGLGGGSADCAAVLKGLNILFELGLTVPELCAIGAGLGADVPFCVLCGTGSVGETGLTGETGSIGSIGSTDSTGLTGSTALAEGIGEKLTLLPAPPPCRIVLVTPDVHCSTKSIFEKFSAMSPESFTPGASPKPPKSPQMAEALKAGSFAQICQALGNDLLDAACSEYPEIADALERLRQTAHGVNMSGSGASCYGLVKL